MPEQLPVWLNEGVEPPDTLKTSGWNPGMKPSAQHMNWWMNRSYLTLKDLQENRSQIIVTEFNIPIAERKPGSFYFFVTDSAPTPSSPNIKVSPSMGLKKMED